MPTLPVTPTQLMRPGIGQNVSYALGDCLTSRPEGHLQPRELWFSLFMHIRESIVLVYGAEANGFSGEYTPVRIHVCVHIHTCTRTHLQEGARAAGGGEGSRRGRGRQEGARAAGGSEGGRRERGRQEGARAAGGGEGGRRERGQQEGARAAGGSEGSRRERGQQEGARAAGGSEGSRRERGQQEGARAAGGGEGSRRGRGQQEGARAAGGGEGSRRGRGQQEGARAAGGSEGSRRERGQQEGGVKKWLSVGGMEEFLHWQLRLATELNWITSAIVAWKVETIEKAFDVRVHQQVEDLQCPIMDVLGAMELYMYITPVQLMRPGIG